jgi:hypothetical protein
MSNYEYILKRAKSFHFNGWNDKDMRECLDLLPTLSHQELFNLYQSKWLAYEKPLKEALFNLLFKDRIEERDRKIKAMNVDELIENLHDENGYGKFIVLEMKERFDSLEDGDKIKIIDTLAATTKANLKWAEGKKKQMNSDK